MYSSKVFLYLSRVTGRLLGFTLLSLRLLLLSGLLLLDFIKICFRLDMAPLVALLAPLVVLVMQFLYLSIFDSLIVLLVTYSWQVDVWNDDLVQSTWCVLPLLAGVTTWVVLIGGVFTSLPWLGAVDLGDWVLRGRRGWVAGEVPSSKTESARHDCEKDLGLRVSLGFLIPIVVLFPGQWLSSPVLLFL